MKVTRLPLVGPWQSSPSQLAGFRAKPQPERSTSARAVSPVWSSTASVSSSRVST
ncbi:hypothetical protein [Goodfellowiella coeruleoviolacea]|uniref:hypothetical protein n=1 Tax=Goodfellowiella coeruleoviolacea TaxID=334858 RepID=UPI0020A5E302|nr:hypothetical protein [Goodfellowiella coeruleoviolacea]